MTRIGLFTAAVAILTHLTAALIRPTYLTRRLSRPTHVKPLAYCPSPHEVEDSYDDLLDLNRAIDPAEAINASMMNNFYESLRFNALGAQLGAPVTRESTLEHLLEKQFGDLHTVPADEEPWMTEVRDIIEKKRGLAIWSKRTDQEIQKEAKKAITSRGMHIPASVATVVNAVFVEKICTLAEMKAEEGVVYAEYRKWLREQREKLKKDPLQAVKLELVKRWLERHPTARAATAAAKAKRASGGSLGLLLRARPTVVLDEVTDILNPRTTHTSLSARVEGAGGSAAFLAPNDEEEEEMEYSATSGMSAAATGLRDSGGYAYRRDHFDHSPLPPAVLSAVPSILNWNKSRRELFAAEHSMMSSSNGGADDGGAGELEVIRRELLRRIASQRQRPASNSEEAVDRSSEENEKVRGSVGVQQGLQEHEEYFVVL